MKSYFEDQYKIMKSCFEDMISMLNCKVVFKRHDFNVKLEIRFQYKIINLCFEYIISDNFYLIASVSKITL